VPSHQIVQRIIVFFSPEDPNSTIRKSEYFPRKNNQALLPSKERRITSMKKTTKAPAKKTTGKAAGNKKKAK